MVLHTVLPTVPFDRDPQSIILRIAGSYSYYGDNATKIITYNNTANYPTDSVLNININL